MSVQNFTCPNCSMTFELQSIKEVQGCPNQECEYYLKYFNQYEVQAAKEFYLTEPSKRRKYLLQTSTENWVVAFCEKAEPFKVENLFDLIEPKALQTIQVGLSHRFNRAIIIIVKFDKKPERSDSEFSIVEWDDKFYGRLDTFSFGQSNCKHCVEIRNNPEGLKRCNECDVRKAEAMINSKTLVSNWAPCWAGLVDYAIPVVINGIIAAVFFTGEIRWIDPEGERELAMGSERVSEIIPSLTKEKLLELVDDINQVRADKETLELMKREYEELVKTIQCVAENRYWAERRAREAEFLSEIASFFATVEDEETLWKVLEVVFLRMKEFFNLSHTAFLLNDNEYEEKYVTRVAAGFTVNRILKLAKEHPEVKFENETLSTIKEDENIPNQELYKKIISLLGVDELDYGFVFPRKLGSNGKSLILTIHCSSSPNKGVSKARKEFIEQVAHEINLEVQNILTITELRKTLREKEDLMATAAHLLVAPLDATYGKTEHLVSLVSINSAISDQVREKIRTLCYKIDADIIRAIRQVRSFLFYTTIGTAAEIYREDKSISLVKVLRELADSFDYLGQRRGIRVEFNVTEEIPDGCFDKDKLEMAFSNLIDNAIKYSHANKKVIVSINFDKKDETYHISVSDFGVGIPEEEIERIFIKYHRSESKDPRRFVPGTGIGLHVVKQIINNYQGEVSVTSKQGQSKLGKESSSVEGYNTTFWIKLPRKRDAI